MKLVLPTALIAMAASPAMACTVVIPKSEFHLHTTEANFQRARDVAVVEVERIEHVETRGLARRVMRFSTVERFKGPLPESFSRDMGQDLGCGPEYLPGQRYVWFLEAPEKNGNDGYFIETSGPLDDGAEWVGRYLEKLRSLSSLSAIKP